MNATGTSPSARDCQHPPQVRVLVVDDERSFREPLARWLHKHAGYHVVQAATAAEAREAVATAAAPFHVALVDDVLTPQGEDAPSSVGMELAQEIRAISPNTEVILFTGWGWDPKRAKAALDAGVYRVLHKPFYVEELKFIIDHLAEVHRLRAHAAEGELLQRLHGLSRQLFAREDTPPLAERIRAVLRQIQELGFDRVRLYRYDEERQELEALACVGMGEREAIFQGLRIPQVQDPYLQRLREAREAVVFTERDRQAVDRQPPGFQELGMAQVPEWACVPLLYGGRFWGKIVVDNRRGQAPIDRRQLRPLELFSAQLAAVLAYESLLQESRRREALLDALAEAARHIRAERDPSRLLHEIVSQGVQILGCQVGDLWINRPAVRDLELVAQVGLDAVPLGYQVVYGQGLVGRVAVEGTLIPVPDYSRWEHRHPAFADCAIHASLGIPIHTRDGQVELILCLGHTDPHARFDDVDVAIARRFAEQAGIAWTKAQLLDHEARAAARTRILNRYHRYLEGCEEELRILHALATCLTADFGLRFNRVALFRWEAGVQEEDTGHLVGLVGIGQVDQEVAEEIWKRLGPWSFDDYLRTVQEGPLALEDPIHRRIEGIRIEGAGEAAEDHVLQALHTRSPVVVGPEELHRLPAALVTAFEPTTEVVLAPLVSRERILGLVVADNKFTGSPITSEIQETLAAFTSTTASVLANLQARREAEQTSRQLQAFLTAQNTLVQDTEPDTLLDTLSDNVREALEADRILVVLYHPRSGPYRGLVRPWREGRRPPPLTEIVRPHGLTHQIVQEGRPRVVQYPEPGEEGHRPAPYFDDIRTALGIPMLHQGQVVGVTWVQYRERRSPSTQVLQVAQLLVDQVTTAYIDVRWAHRLRTMQQALERLGQVEHPEAILQVVVDHARQLVQADSGVLYVFDPATWAFDYERSVHSGLDPERWRRLQGVNSLPDATAERVLATGWLEVPSLDDSREGWMGAATRQVLASLGVHGFVGLALRTPQLPLLGVLYLHFRNPYLLDEGDRILLRSLVEHAASALERTRLLARLRQVHEASRRIAELATRERLEETLRAVAEEVSAILQADAVTLYPYHEEKHRLSAQPIAVGVRHPERMREATAIDPDSIVYRMLERREPYYTEGVSQDPLFRGRRFTQEEEIQALAAFPLRVHGHPVGVMFVNYRRPHRFASTEKEDLTLLAHQAAVVIRSAQVRDRLQERAQMLRQLAEAARQISASLDVQTILEGAVRTAAEITGTYGPRAKLTLVALEDAEQPGTLVFRAAEPPDLLPGLRDGVGRLLTPEAPRLGLIGRTFRECASQRVDDVRKDPDYICVDETIRSALAVPIAVGDRVLGVLGVESDQIGAFDEEDQEALELLAAEIGVALENARQYRELQEAKGLLGQRTLLAWAGMADNLWRHTNAKQALVIRETAGLIGQELESWGSSEPLEQIRKWLQRIEKAAWNIQNRPTLSPPNPEDVESVELVSLVAHRIRILHRNHPAYRVVRFRRPSFQAVYTRAHPEWLRRALDILVDNALDATMRVKAPEVIVSIALESSWAEIRVQDNGTGIPPELRDKIGRRFAMKAGDDEGLGMGLIMAQVLLEAYGGQLRIVETGEQGTTMALRLPIFSG